MLKLYNDSLILRIFDYLKIDVDKNLDYILFRKKCDRLSTFFCFLNRDNNRKSIF